MKTNFLKAFIGFGAILLVLGLADAGSALRKRRGVRGSGQGDHQPGGGPGR